MILFLSKRKDELKGDLSKWLKEQQHFDQNLSTLKTQLEELTVKDQSLDRHFRTFFMDLVSSAVIDQAIRIFK